MHMRVLCLHVMLFMLCCTRVFERMVQSSFMFLEE